MPYTVYKRHVYNDLEKMMKESAGKGFHITGNPGIGKSCILRPKAVKNGKTVLYDTIEPMHTFIISISGFLSYTK